MDIGILGDTASFYVNLPLRQPIQEQFHFQFPIICLVRNIEVSPTIITRSGRVFPIHGSDETNTHFLGFWYLKIPCLRVIQDCFPRCKRDGKGTLGWLFLGKPLQLYSIGKLRFYRGLSEKLKNYVKIKTILLK